MKRLIVLAGSLSLIAGVALAQSPAIGERQSQFKQMDVIESLSGKMFRGEQPFDLAKIQDGLKQISALSKSVRTLFPEDSKEGKTRALPIIWEDKARFEAGFARLDEVARLASETIRDEASFKAEIPKVFQTCVACHRAARGRQ